MKMLNKTGYAFWRREWEQAAHRAVAVNDHSGWRYECARLWTLDFCEGLTDADSYQHPLERIPFPYSANEPRDSDNLFTRGWDRR
jgi:hypothetical protein